MIRFVCFECNVVFYLDLSVVGRLLWTQYAPVVLTFELGQHELIKNTQNNCFKISQHSRVFDEHTLVYSVINK